MIMHGRQKFEIQRRSNLCIELQFYDNTGCSFILPHIENSAPFNLAN